MNNQSLYQARLLELYKFSPYRGALEHPTMQSGVVNPSCGDSISITALSDNGILTTVRFQGTGCVISQAAASLTVEAVQGKTFEQIRALTPEDILKLLGIPLGPTRLRCGILALEALHSALGAE